MGSRSTENHFRTVGTHTVRSCFQHDFNNILGDVLRSNPHLFTQIARKHRCLITAVSCSHMDLNRNRCETQQGQHERQDTEEDSTGPELPIVDRLGRTDS